MQTDTMGDKLGRVHLGKQDLSELQTRKMKGLKRLRDVDTEIDMEEDIVSGSDEDMDGGGVTVKKMRIAEV